jgi:hypothetical protein
MGSHYFVGCVDTPTLLRYESHRHVLHPYIHIYIYVYPSLSQHILQSMQRLDNGPAERTDSYLREKKSEDSKFHIFVIVSKR